ncbi:response regulator transcription factor [Streptomyces sp. NPDC035033]|uniref:helix-turn-helix transcriptional regulator n=1 Tax=Streptomyces sp. NPDC035033 TaxID=3155368 RepID=UPI0033EF2D6C
MSRLPSRPGTPRPGRFPADPAPEAGEPGHGNEPPARPPFAERTPPPLPLTVAVHSEDRLSREATEACLGLNGRLSVLPPEEHHRAAVVLMLATDVTERTLTQMERMVRAAETPDVPVLLVADRIGERRLLQALGLGLVGFLPRDRANMTRLRQLLWEGASGRAVLPGSLVGVLIRQVRHLQRHVLEPHGLAIAGFTEREVEVLRMLSEGVGTADIARRLNYSERTIKNILAAMMSRVGLRNRSHAVAYALRTGAI